MSSSQLKVSVPFGFLRPFSCLRMSIYVRVLSLLAGAGSAFLSCLSGTSGSFVSNNPGPLYTAAGVLRSSSFKPVDSHGDLRFSLTFRWESSITELQSNVTLSALLALLWRLSLFHSVSVIAGRFAGFPDMAAVSALLTAFSLIAGSVPDSTLAPQTLQNLAPSDSLLPQFLQNTMLPPECPVPGHRTTYSRRNAKTLNY